jgi:hypothetical protein
MFLGSFESMAARAVQTVVRLQLLLSALSYFIWHGLSWHSVLAGVQLANAMLPSNFFMSINNAGIRRIYLHCKMQQDASP